jgi:hypothetical protein
VQDQGRGFQRVAQQSEVDLVNSEAAWGTFHFGNSYTDVSPPPVGAASGQLVI